MTTKTISQLRSLSEKLSGMPIYDDPDRKVTSKRETVAVLSRGINDMIKRGYPIERIAEILHENGVDLAPPTLRSYLREARPGKKKARATGTDTTT